MEQSQTLPTRNRLGLHYFPDLLHYRQHDLETWLPQLTRMGIGWLTLMSPSERAIPEAFIKGLLSAGIQPLLHFPLAAHSFPPVDEFRLLFSNYARWGVQYAALFDRPNNRSNWSAATWAQTDLVERFLDQYLPLAEAAATEGLLPIFPPLEPGGDYWDLSFLHSALQGMQRRGKYSLLDRLSLGAYAWTGDRSLEWGAGGPERWTGVAPYSTPADSEDQRGFRIFDWYLAVAQRELGRRLPVFLLRAGSLPDDQLEPDSGQPDYLAHAERNLTIARLLADQPLEGHTPVPPEVIAGAFWLLAAHEKSAFAGQSWFTNGDEKLPIVNSLYRFAASQVVSPPAPEKDAEPISSIANDDERLPVELSPGDTGGGGYVDSLAMVNDPPASLAGDLDLAEWDPPLSQTTPASEPARTISHYVLLPLYAWGAADWDLELIQPLLQETHPTVGFSLEEARLAARVTVVGGSGAVSAEALEMLRASGCKVERILDNGMLIAS